MLLAGLMTFSACGEDLNSTKSDETSGQNYTKAEEGNARAPSPSL